MPCGRASGHRLPSHTPIFQKSSHKKSRCTQLCQSCLNVLIVYMHFRWNQISLGNLPVVGRLVQKVWAGPCSQVQMQHRGKREPTEPQQQAETWSDREEDEMESQQHGRGPLTLIHFPLRFPNKMGRRWLLHAQMHLWRQLPCRPMQISLVQHWKAELSHPLPPVELPPKDLKTRLWHLKRTRGGFSSVEGKLFLCVSDSLWRQFTSLTSSLSP